MKVTGMLGCLGRKVTVFAHIQVSPTAVQKEISKENAVTLTIYKSNVQKRTRHPAYFPLYLSSYLDVCFSVVSAPLGVSLSLSSNRTHIGLP